MELWAKNVAVFGKRKLGRFLAGFDSKSGGFWFETIRNTGSRINDQWRKCFESFQKVSFQTSFGLFKFTLIIWGEKRKLPQNPKLSYRQTNYRQFCLQNQSFRQTILWNFGKNSDTSVYKKLLFSGPFNKLEQIGETLLEFFV